MRRRSRPGGATHLRRCAGSLFVSLVAHLSFLECCLSRIPALSMGQPAARSRLSRNLFCAAAIASSTGARAASFTGGFMAFEMAPLPPDAQLRAGEVDERRSDVEKSHRAQVSL